MKISLRFRRMWGNSSTSAVMKPSTVQNWRGCRVMSTLCYVIHYSHNWNTWSLLRISRKLWGPKEQPQEILHHNCFLPGKTNLGHALLLTVFVSFLFLFVNMIPKTQLWSLLFYLTVDSQHQQHGEKEYGPQWRDGQLGNSLRVSQKCKARSWLRTNITQMLYLK